MSEGREQDQPEERESAARPVTAAARRERRASARPAVRKDAAESTRATKKVAGVDSDAAGAKGRPTRGRDSQEKRPNIFARFFRYLREVVSELRKVIWPTRKQLITYTSVVLVFVAFMVAVVFGLDAAFAWGVFKLFG
ncbi:preprotein translocase subunit SecE [Umezawaea beigongshangensis]|uniref:preprotein translocase subunit SecE n=1 Tax=Umezawaea beigongshangensis TaxID=2780383 RepID=UPI0018F1517C|nr:preprotein translocase subunit SecE [Umezawaea beigongshangensis]